MGSGPPGSRTPPSRIAWFGCVRARATCSPAYRGTVKRSVNGRWRRCEAGTVLLTARHTVNAFRAVAEARWRFAWIHYDDARSGSPFVSAPAAAFTDADPALLAASLSSLHAEWIGLNEPAMIDHLAQLVYLCGLRLARATQMDSRLFRLWTEVDANLDRHWTLARLARTAGLSAEHLRRLGQQHFGRSPIRHVAHLRMLRAAARLRLSDEKVETIATEVGYGSLFSFSTAFKKCTGSSPSEYRQKVGRSARAVQPVQPPIMSTQRSRR